MTEIAQAAEGCCMKHLVSIDTIHTFFKSDFKKDYVFGGERHNFWEIVFVLDGTVGITADADIYVLEKGQAVIHRPNEFHKIWSEFETNPTVIVFSCGASSFPFDGERIVSLDTSSVKKIEELYAMSFDCFDRTGIAVSGIKNGCEPQAEYFRLCTELFLHSLLYKHPHVTGSGVRSAEIYASAVKYMEQAPDAGF